MTVNRARKMERFLSQPFFVAEQFTGIPGRYVPVAESIRGFKEILEGKHDEMPERAFFMKGSIDEVVAEAAGQREERVRLRASDDAPRRPGRAEARPRAELAESESETDQRRASGSGAWRTPSSQSRS